VDRLTVESCATQQLKLQVNNNMKMKNFKLLFELAALLKTILNLTLRFNLFTLACLDICLTAFPDRIEIQHSFLKLIFKMGN
jgi:hypothetical protein